jgi:hypothetical protein
VGCDQCRARDTEEVKSDTSATRDVFHRIDDQCDRLDRRMQGKLVESARFAGIDASIFPNVGAIAPVLAKLETVDCGASPFLKAKMSLCLER